MNKEAHSVSLQLVVSTAILLILAVFVFVTNATVCRYVTTISGKMLLKPVGHSFDVNASAWVEDTSSGISSMDLSVQAERDTQFRIRVLAPADALLDDFCIVADGVLAEASFLEISEGTPLYMNNNRGLLCRFLNTEGEEIYFDTADGSFLATLSVAGETSDLEFLVEPINSDQNGGNS